MALSNKDLLLIAAGIRQDIAKGGKVGVNILDMFTTLCNSSLEESILTKMTDEFIQSNKDKFFIFRDALCASALYNIICSEIKTDSRIVEKSRIKDKYSEGYRVLKDIRGSVANLFSTINPVLDRLGVEDLEIQNAAVVVNILGNYKGVSLKDIDNIKEKENEELNRQEEETPDETGDSYDAWENTINLTIERILVTLEELYTSGYEGTTPAGLLIGEYILSVRCKDDGSGEFEFYNRKKNVEMYRLYKWINKTADGIFDMSKCHGNMKPSVENFKKGVGYFPNYQMRNASGLKGLDPTMDRYLADTFDSRNRFNNFNELGRYLRVELDRIIRKGFADSNIDPDDFESKKPQQLIDKFASIIPRAILITDWNTKTAVKLKICCGDEATLAKFSQSSFEKAIADGEILSPHIKVVDTRINNGVLTTTLLFNETMYYNYPLFAYTSLEAIKRTGKIDWGNVILGVRSDDRIARINLKDNKAAVISMIAGTRSGKGVMTLNLIASAMACGYPIMYMDCKPEMSRDLWNLANKYGKEMFTFDGAPDSIIDVDRPANKYYDTANLPEPFVKCMRDWGSGGLEGFARFTCYIRGIEFLNVLIKERAAATAQGGNLLDSLGGERLLFVVDELENFFKNWGSLRSHVDTQLGIYEEEQVLSKAVKKADKNINPFRQYWTRYRNWAKSQFAQLNALSTGKMSQANINIFVIAQTVEIDSNWDKELAPLIGGIIKKMSLRICGNGTSSGGGSHVYGTGKISDSQKSLLTNWYFAVAKKPATAVLEADNVDMVRPYFLLPRLYNEDGGESKALQDLRSNTLDKYPDVAADVTDNSGKVMPELAFEGYVQNLLGGNANAIGETLNRGWVVASKIIQEKTGLDVVNYMYNLTNFSMFSGENEDVGEAHIVLPDGEASETYNGWVQREQEEDSSELQDFNEETEATPTEKDNSQGWSKEPEVDSRANNIFGKYGSAATQAEEEELAKLKLEQENRRRSLEAQNILNQAGTIEDEGDEFDVPIMTDEEEPQDIDTSDFSLNEFDSADFSSDEFEQSIDIDTSGFSSDEDFDFGVNLNSTVQSPVQTPVHANIYKQQEPVQARYEQQIPVQANLNKSTPQTNNSRAPIGFGGITGNQSVAPQMEPIQQNIPNSNKKVINMGDIFRARGINPQDLPKEAISVREVHTNSQAYQTGKGKDSDVVFVETSNIHSDKQRLTEDNSIYCSPATYLPITKYDKLMCKSPYGVKYWRKKMFEKLLDDVETYGVGLYPIKSSVNTVTLKKENMFINSKICNTNGSYSGETGRNLSDYVIFSLLAKRCPMISTLKMDDSFIKAFMMETGLLNPDDYIDRLFKMFPMLVNLELDGMQLNKTDYMRINEAVKNQQRLDAQERKLAEKLAKQKANMQDKMEKERARDEFDASLQQMVPSRQRGNELEWAIRGAGKSKDYWSKTEQALLEENKKGKALGYGVFTVVTLGFSAIAGIGGLGLKVGRKITGGHRR